jgi:integrase/recombinase XerD
MEIELAPPQGIAILNPTRVEELLNKFIYSLDVKESSRDLYKRTLRLYFSWVGKSGLSLSSVAREEILAYKDFLLSSNKSSLSVGSYITSVRRFYEWAEANKYYPNVAKGVKSPKRKQQFKKQPLLPAQAVSLLDHCQAGNLRDFAIVNLLLRTGLRTVEVIRANVGDIVFKGTKKVLLIQGKGRDEKDNFVLLTDKAYTPLKAYLDTRINLKDEEPLFTSTSRNNMGERLSTRTISYIAKEGLKSIGLDEKAYTAHSLRHTTAVNILRGGGSLEMAQMTLRHSNPATTQIYTATLNEERRLQNSGEALIDSMY